MTDQALGAELLERQPHADQDFLDANRDALLAAVVERPGVDSVRAVVLRELPRLGVDAEEAERLLQDVAVALRSYPDAVASGDPVQLMARHPAWVGLAHLELVDRLDGDRVAALEVAVQHARLGFSSASGGAVQDGETLWAMAETAEEVGWDDRTDELLQLAVASEFADAGARDQVALILATRLAPTDASRARQLLETVARGDGDAPTRVQSAFVLSRLAEADHLIGRAREWLSLAREIAAEAGDDDVVRTLDAELSRLGVA